MADRNPPEPRSTPRHTNSNCSVSSFLRNLQFHAPNQSRLAGFLTLVISGSILLLLAGITATATILGLVIFTPLILISSPVWIPVGTFLFVAAAGVLSVCGFGLVAAAVTSWMYRYFRGLNPPGSGRVDYARSRIYDTASHVKDCAREYGGYLQSKVKDAAPGA